LAAEVWFNPVLSIVDSVGVWKLLNVESIFFSGLLFLLLLERLSFGVLGSVLPVVNAIIRSADDMSSVHGDEFWVDVNFLALDWATDGIAESDHPRWLGFSFFDEL
jgi:hypothetical protein